MFMEDKTTELKREYVDDIKKTVIAFANCDGGTIYIGIDDDGSVCGVDDADGTMLRVTNAIRDAVRPDITMFVECVREEMEGRLVVAVSVQRGTARPYYLQNKGLRPEGVYVRQGASTVPASDTAILAMIRETGGDSYEVARSLNQQLTFEKTAAYFRKKGLELGRAQMRTLHMISEDSTYTNLAFLLSEQGTHTIKLAVFEGSKKTVFKDRKELSGSLLEQMEDAFDFIDRFNRTRAEFSGLERIDTRDYPVEAVREALLNAVVHRDYAFSGPTLISIFDDRMELVSIGGLLRGIVLEDILLGVSSLRNEHLANIFYRLRLIEAYGTGVWKINECYADYPVKPMIETTRNAFKITLPNVNYRKEHPEERASRVMTINESRAEYAVRPVIVRTGTAGRTKKEEQIQEILDLCAEKGYIIRKDVEAALGVSQAKAILLLRELTEEGALVKTGASKNIRYYPGASEKL